MKSVRSMLLVLGGAVCLAVLSGCETQQSACEREKRLTERLDELQMDVDGRWMSVNAEVAAMRANPPVIVQQVPVPTPMTPVVDPYAGQTAPSGMSVDTISIEDDFYGSSKRQQLEQLAASARQEQLYDAPAPRRSSGGTSNAANHIRVPVPVRTVQAALKEAGHYPGSIDGKVGRQTIAGITSFQRSQGIKADGIVGKQTWQLLYPYVPAGMSTQRLK